MRWLMICLFVFAVAGCASYPATPEQTSSSYIQQATYNVGQGNVNTALMYFNLVADMNGQEKQLASLFARDPKLKDFYFNQTLLTIKTQARPNELSDIVMRSQSLVENGILSKEESQQIRDQAISRAIIGNQSGDVPFMLTNRMKGLGLLESQDQMSIILNRSLAAEKEMRQQGMIQAIAAYASKPSTTKEQKRLIADSLDDLRVTNDAVYLLADAFPEFTQKRKAILNKVGPDAGAAFTLR